MLHKVLPSKLDRFLGVLWEKIAALTEFRELWYFNAKVRYYCSLAYFIQYKKSAWGGHNHVEKPVFSCLDKH